MASKAKVGVLGASGYTGSELVRMLLRHPRAEIVLLTADRSAGKAMRDVFPQFSPFELPKLVAIDSIDFANAGLDLVFCALPHGTTQTVIKDLLAKAPATKVVDLSADFRLHDTAAYAKWYGHEHHAPELQKEAVYGLSEIYRREIKKARLVANPGCYTSCAELPLIPLIKAKAIDLDEIVVDAKSGMTGAGRAAKEVMLFSEVSEGFNAYGVGRHRHMAELDQEFSLAAGREVIVSFTPHLVPMNRGILSTIYVRGKRGRSAQELHALLLKSYAKEPFVHVLPFGETPHTRHVRGSNMTFIGVASDRIEGRAILVSALDNLVKGASGQAIQNMNLVLGYPETMGLEQVALFRDAAGALAFAAGDRAMFEVTNQPPPLEPYNLFASDTVLREAVAREGVPSPGLQSMGQVFGTPEVVALGFAANRNPPQLKSYDRYGHRLDEVEFHPAWHDLLGIACAFGLHSHPWAQSGPGAHVARAAGTYMLTQIESGVYCPVAMTYGSVPTLRQAPEIAAEWLPKIFNATYDRRFAPVSGKTGALIGMAMTENQGGSDLRMNTTRAEPAADRSFRLHGHKWFMSAPMCDAFLVLAQSAKGLGCFFMPRWTPDGKRNAIQFNRLKDKLGNKSNASSEVEFLGAYARLIGEEGRGIPTIIEMAGYTRLDCCIGSSGLMRQAVVQAVHHARHRTAFQKHLIDQPLMTNVLADLALKSEAATVLTIRLARAYDESDETSQVYRRVVTPAAKFWICKRAPFVNYEAMEVLGGSGYIEECIMPRLYREAPVNSIWEGAGNIMCLDVLRAIERTPKAADVLNEELSGADPRLKAFAERLQKRLSSADRNDESQARVLVRDLVLALQAALLIKHSPPAVADAFCASRLDGGSVFGTLPRGFDLRAIAERAAPAS